MHTVPYLVSLLASQVHNCIDSVTPGDIKEDIYALTQKRVNFLLLDSVKCDWSKRELEERSSSSTSTTTSQKKKAKM